MALKKFTELATEDQDFILGKAFHFRANEANVGAFIDEVDSDEVDHTDLRAIWDKSAFLTPLFLGAWEQFKKETEALR